MKKEHLDSLKVIMDNFLGKCDEDGGNPEWCYMKLADDMAKAAALVYDSCMAGQKFHREQMVSLREDELAALLARAFDAGAKRS